jgi:hypothetical protein
MTRVLSGVVGWNYLWEKWDDDDDEDSWDEIHQETNMLEDEEGWETSSEREIENLSTFEYPDLNV